VTAAALIAIAVTRTPASFKSKGRAMSTAFFI
jgi:hypothetical protein